MDNLDFSILQRAGITSGNFRHLIQVPLPYGGYKGISATSVYKWIKGLVTPDEHTRPVIKELLGKIETAVEAGRLPLPLSTPRTGKNDKIRVAVFPE